MIKYFLLLFNFLIFPFFLNAENFNSFPLKISLQSINETEECGKGIADYTLYENETFLFVWTCPKSQTVTKYKGNWSKSNDSKKIFRLTLSYQMDNADYFYNDYIQIYDEFAEVSWMSADRFSKFNFLDKNKNISEFVASQIDSENNYKSQLASLVSEIVIFKYLKDTHYLVHQNNSDRLISKKLFDDCLSLLKRFREDGRWKDFRKFGNTCNAEVYEILPNNRFDNRTDSFFETFTFDKIDNNSDGFIDKNELQEYYIIHPHNIAFLPLPRRSDNSYPSFKKLYTSINLPNIQKAMEFEWRDILLIYNKEDEDFRNKSIKANNTRLHEDLNFDGTLTFQEFIKHEYLKDYLRYVENLNEENLNDKFQKDVKRQQEYYEKRLAKLNIKKKTPNRTGTSCGGSFGLNESELILLINTVNSYGYNFKLQNVVNCSLIKNRGFISFKDNSLTIYFDTNLGFLIRNYTGGRGVCIKPGQGPFEVYNQIECF